MDFLLTVINCKWTVCSNKKVIFSSMHVVNASKKLKLKTGKNCKQQDLCFVSSLFTDDKNKREVTLYYSLH